MVKNLEDMTLEEALKVLEARLECGRCSECFAGSSNWEDSCREVSEHALQVVRDAFIKSTATDKQKASTEPFYQQTVDFMKKSGYTHCYMCGSELE